MDMPAYYEVIFSKKQKEMFDYLCSYLEKRANETGFSFYKLKGRYITTNPSIEVKITNNPLIDKKEIESLVESFISIENNQKTFDEHKNQ